MFWSLWRCCVKTGQIAHLDHNHNNNEPDNLAFLCLVHHDQYDSKTSQSKGLRENEIKRYRTELYTNVSAALSRAEEKFLEYCCDKHSKVADLLVAYGGEHLDHVDDKGTWPVFSHAE
jgi:hypothetical protein